MQFNRAWLTGIAGGLIVALLGPAGIATGHSSHPVGEASHPERGALFGTITDADTGEPIDGVCVEASHRWRWRGPKRTRTSGGGHYWFPAVYTGSNVIYVDPNCARSPVAGIYAPIWFDDALTRGDAESVMVRRQETSIVDLALRKAGTVEIEATDSVSGAPLRTCARLYPASQARFDVSEPDQVYGWRHPAYEQSAVEFGEASMLAPAGRFRLLVGCLGWEAPERPAPYGYIPTWTEPFDVVEQATTSIAVSLTRAGVIAGTLRDQNDKPVESTVQFWATKDDVAERAYASPGFESGRLSAGEYRLSVGWHYWWGWYDVIREWFDDAGSFGAADPVTVVPGRATLVDWQVEVEWLDVAVLDVEVRDPSVRTTLTAFPSPGLNKEIDVTIAELSGREEETYRRLCVWAEPADIEYDPSDYWYGSSYGPPRERIFIGDVVVPGDSQLFERTFSWTPEDLVGDVRIVVKVANSYRWGGSDAMRSNDVKRADTFVLVGGAGSHSTDTDLPYVPYVGSFLNDYDYWYC